MSASRARSTSVERKLKLMPFNSDTTIVKKQLDAFVDYAHEEKHELSQLNSQMSSYLNRVKQLEAENSNLTNAINNRKATWGDETSRIKEEYEKKLLDMRDNIDEVAQLKTVADLRNKRSAYENGEYEYQLENSNRLRDAQKNKIHALERELFQLNDSHNFLMQAVDTELKDIDKLKNHRDETWSGLVDLLDKLDDELFRRISVEYNNQTLREQIEFLRQVNELELAEMAQLGEALPFNEQIEFYKDQLKRVISNIRKDYENLHLEQMKEMEEWMAMKRDELEKLSNQKDPSHDLEMQIFLENIEKLRNEFKDNSQELDNLKNYHNLMAKRLHDAEVRIDLERGDLNQTLEDQEKEIARLRAELNALTDDCNHVNINKANLEYEINVYKRLLNSQTDRLPDVPIEKFVPAPAPKSNDVSVENESFGGLVKNKKEKTGSVGISDAASDGKFVQIENDGPSEVVDISGWQLKRKIETKDSVFTFPNQTVIKKGENFKVWGKSSKHLSSQSDFSADFDWGVGLASLTSLIDNNGNERSFFDQQISFNKSY